MNQNEDKKEKKKLLRISGLVRPMIYEAIFSILYSIGYMWMTQSSISATISQLLQAVWLALYGISWYFCAALVWGKKHGVLSGMQTSLVFIWNLCFVALANLIVYLYKMVISPASVNTFLLLLVQLSAGAILIFGIPTTILFYKQLYDQKEDFAQILRNIWTSIKKHSSAILNSWLCLFLLMVAWDTLFSGPLTVYFGFNACLLLINLLYIGNPMFYWIMMLMLSMANESFIYLIILYIFSGVFFLWLEMNMIAIIGEHCEDRE